jgi:diguanylate cyclase (GGDEF)-like protein
MIEGTQLRPEGGEQQMRSSGRLAAFGRSVIELPEWALHVSIALGAVAIAAAATFAGLEFTTYYVFVAVAVAIIFPRPKPIAAHLALVCAGLVAPIFLGGQTGEPALLLAVVTAPSLCMIAAVVASLVARLQETRAGYRAQALTDELTGVGNYRALHQALDREIARHQRSGRSFALIVIDLNGFKQVNEYFGHVEGDRVLAGVGAKLRDTVRAGDLAFRQGGDEFAVLAPESAPKQADRLCIRLRDELAGTGSELTPVSAACGSAIFPRDGRDADQLLRAADANLMTGKRDHPIEESLA